VRGITRPGPVSIAVIAAVTVLALLALGGAAPISSPGRLAIAGSLPNWLSQGQRLGVTPGNNRIDFGLVVRMRDHDDAVGTLQRISDPDSPDYGRWLSNEHFRSRFAPVPSDVAAVRDWILSQGFRVDKILPSGMYIEASGTAARVGKVFGTTVDNYTNPRSGRGSTGRSSRRPAATEKLRNAMRRAPTSSKRSMSRRCTRWHRAPMSSTSAARTATPV
jgi:subtilase family serine protease